jgi:hypothetical protein
MPTVLPSGLEAEIAGSEPLARFLVSSGQYGLTVVKPSAFLPSPDRETSVFRHGPTPVPDLWKLAEEHVESHGRRVHGAAIVTAAAVRESSLSVESSEPPPRHAVIRGWYYCDDPEFQKSKQKAAALELVRHALLIKQ